MAKKKKPSRTSMTQFLRDCVIDPRNPGPMKVMIESVPSPSYLESRAIELIAEGQEAHSLNFEEMTGPELYEDRIKKAIALLSLSVLLRRG